MRIAIEYSAAVNQRAGIGRLVRNQVLALAEVDQDNDYRLVYARPNPGRVPTYPDGSNVTPRVLRVNERWTNIVWHRLQAPIPAD